MNKTNTTTILCANLEILFIWPYCRVVCLPLTKTNKNYNPPLLWDHVGVAQLCEVKYTVTHTYMQMLSLSKFLFKSNHHLEALPKTVHENPKQFNFKLF